MLLTKNVDKRCCQTSLIKELKLFKGYEWDKLIDMKLTGPFIPSFYDDKNFLQGSTRFEKAMEQHENPELESTTIEKSQENYIGHTDNTHHNWEEEF